MAAVMVSSSPEHLPELATDGVPVSIAAASAPTVVREAGSPSNLRTAALCVSTFVIGLGGAVQVTVNARCGSHFNIGIFGTVISFGGGLILLTCMVAAEVHASHRRFSAARLAASTAATETAPPNAVEPPAAGPSSVAKAAAPPPPVMKPMAFLRWSRWPSWYHLIPGLIGICFVTGSIYLTVYIGYALFWIPAVTGQLTCSAVLDHIGYSLAGRPIPISLKKGIALLVAVTGAALSVADRVAVKNEDEGGANIGVVIGCILTCLVIGCLMPVQAALNRSAAQLLPSKLQATWWSFACGTLAAMVVLIIQMCLQPADSERFPDRFADSDWYMYLGGPLGVAYIGSTVIFTGIIGSAPYFVCLVCGQLVGSAWIDATGAFASPIRIASGLRVAGILLVIVAAAAMQLQVPSGWMSCTPRPARKSVSPLAQHTEESVAEGSGATAVDGDRGGG